MAKYKYGKKRLSLTGLKELKDTLSLMSSEVDGARIYQVMGDAVRPMQLAARNNIMYLSVHVGMSIYLAKDPPPSRPKLKTVKLVVHKADTMREWVAGKFSTSPKSKVASGSKVAESLANMWEEGTSRTWRNGPGVPAKHWFGSAVESRKSEVKANLIAGFTEIINEVIANRQIPIP